MHLYKRKFNFSKFINLNNLYFQSLVIDLDEMSNWTLLADSAGKKMILRCF